MAASQQTPNSSMSASHSSSRSRGSYPQVTCYHNEIALLRVVKHNGPTMRKRTCGFFKWADELDDVRELQELILEKDITIAELEMDKEMLTLQLKDLKSKNLISQDKIEELGIENAEKDLTMYSAWVD
ncbi:UDP-3-O-acylglucosamine N-acyltransferase [Bienertia sinuspersici]